MEIPNGIFSHVPLVHIRELSTYCLDVFSRISGSQSGRYRPPGGGGKIWGCDSNSVLCDELRNMKHDIAYLADIFTKFNEVNLQLQGNEANLIKVKSAISTFLAKLQLFKRNIARHALYQFPSLSELDKEKGISDDDLQVYCTHLDELHRDMSKRFEDILLLEIPDWVINPFLNVNGEETGVAEEELI
ncbi:zinc finger BED domain-containing protein 5-like [Portunus trituberculatus]|uniref:zinc finger BED domain-containing protein 5-like n=1 Tax=Portunus trituberculatus TaxID=210409 RepID=UPI001E1D0B3D|nr:zinc finger BED domain-containing protein 5-like [Portunus trituberculatus]